MNGPLSLGDLFGNAGESENQINQSNDKKSENDDNKTEFEQNYELQNIKILDK